jgi:hypothetical protein
MDLNIYSIYDSAAEAFTQPFFMHNDGLAIRAFQDNVNASNENNISNHPEQFTLFRIGKFSDNNGKVDSEPQPVSLALGIEMKNPDKEIENLFQNLERLIKERKK